MNSFQKELWTNVHIQGIFHMFDEEFWNIPTIFSNWVSKYSSFSNSLITVIEKLKPFKFTSG